MKYANRVRVTHNGTELKSIQCLGKQETVQAFAREVLNLLETEIERCQVYTLEAWEAERAEIRDNWSGGRVVVEIV